MRKRLVVVGGGLPHWQSPSNVNLGVGARERTSEIVRGYTGFDSWTPRPTVQNLPAGLGVLESYSVVAARS
jgi:hypothetical protein